MCVRKNGVNKSKCKDNSKKRKIGFCAYQDGEEKMEEEKLSLPALYLNAYIHTHPRNNLSGRNTSTISNNIKLIE